MIIKSMKSIVFTTYEGGDLHILDVRATELQHYKRLSRLIPIIKTIIKSVYSIV